MLLLDKIGGRAWERLGRLRHVVAVAWAVVRLAVQPDSWPRTARTVLARQIVFTGLDAMQFVAFVALVTGVSVVVQAQLWIGKLGQSELLGPLLVTVIVREVGPLLVNFIVIGRSATAMAAELAGMKVRNEVDVLDAQGVDPLLYLVMPRSVAVALSVFCLTLYFVLVSFGSGYLCGAFLGTGPGDPSVFLRSVLQGVAPDDFVNLLAKTLIPGLLTGVITGIEGLSIEGVATDIPVAVTRSVVRSNMALLLVSVIVSVLSYV